MNHQTLFELVTYIISIFKQPLNNFQATPTPKHTDIRLLFRISCQQCMKTKYDRKRIRWSNTWIKENCKNNCQECLKTFTKYLMNSPKNERIKIEKCLRLRIARSIQETQRKDKGKKNRSWEEYNHVITTKEPLMMKSIRILTKYLMKAPKMGRNWDLKMPQIKNCQKSKQEMQRKDKGKKNRSWEEYNHVIMAKEPLMMKSIRILTKYLMKSPKMGRKWELKSLRLKIPKNSSWEEHKHVIMTKELLRMKSIKTVRNNMQWLQRRQELMSKNWVVDPLDHVWMKIVNLR